jgi:hypothetical protein
MSSHVCSGVDGCELRGLQHIRIIKYLLHKKLDTIFKNSKTHGVKSREGLMCIACHRCRNQYLMHECCAVLILCICESVTNL